MQENNTSMAAKDDIDQAQFEADKRAVYKHPLFSLLALMLEKCEQATQGYIPKATASPTSSSSTNSTLSNGSETSANNCQEGDVFTKDIQTFVQLLQKENRPILSNNPELDSLMIKALQVLRIHLLELEKVQELCRDFCTRYIACLRGKLQSENLLRSDYSLEHNNNLSHTSSPSDIPDPDCVGTPTPYFFDNADYVNGNNDNEATNVSNGSYNLPAVARVDPKYNEHSNSSAFASSDLPLNAAGLRAIDCPPGLLEDFADQLSQSSCSEDGDSEMDSNNDDLSSNLSSNSNSKRQKRGILPKHATSVMRAWLFQHLVHPYPTEDEKRAIAAQTNLTLLQVNNWFINARRRIIQPMLEHANDCSQPHNPSTTIPLEN